MGKQQKPQLRSWLNSHKASRSESNLGSISILRSHPGRSHATLPVPTRCVTPARAAAKETRAALVENEISQHWASLAPKPYILYSLIKKQESPPCSYSISTYHNYFIIQLFSYLFFSYSGVSHLYCTLQREKKTFHISRVHVERTCCLASTAVKATTTPRMKNSIG